MPRRRKRQKGQQQSTSKTSRRRRSSSSRKKWTLDMDTVVPQVASAVIERLGLDYAGIRVDDIRDIVEDIVRGIAESRSTKPSVETLIKKIVKNPLPFKKAVAAKLVTRESLSGEQVEFIVATAPEIAGRAAPRLYREARRLGLEHIVDSLRYLWLRYGRPTPFECPRCGFKALTPELSCMVCGARVDEEEFKSHIGFEMLLREMAETRPSEALEAADSGFVLYDGEKLLPPSRRAQTPLLIELYLTSRERSLLRSLAIRARTAEAGRGGGG